MILLITGIVVTILMFILWPALIDFLLNTLVVVVSIFGLCFFLFLFKAQLEHTRFNQDVDNCVEDVSSLQGWKGLPDADLLKEIKNVLPANDADNGAVQERCLSILQELPKGSES